MMKAQYHPNSTDREEVEILDIFVDRDGQPRMMFVRANGHVLTAPIGRFTELRNGAGPVKSARRFTDPSTEESEEPPTPE